MNSLNTLKIQKAKSADAKKVAPLFDLYRQFYNRPSDLAAAEQFLSERLSSDDSVVLWASDEVKAFGFVQLYPSFSSLSMQRLWILNDLFVLPECRRNSVGRQLLQAAVLFARESKARGLTLKTALDNQAAQNLYSSLGWKKDERYYSFDFSLSELETHSEVNVGIKPL